MHILEEFEQTQNQQMDRIECIIEILQGLAVVALLATVQPDGDQCQQSKALLHDEMGFSPELDFIRIAAEHFYIDTPQSQKLCRIAPPLPMTEAIKYENCQDACVIVVHHCQQAADIGNEEGQDSHENSQPDAPCLYLFVPMDQADGNQETPQDILMNGVEESAAYGKIKGNLGQNGKNQHTQHIFAQIPCVEITFDD